MNTIKNNVVRPLGILERFFQIMHDIDVGFIIRYKIPINLSSISSPISDETKNIILRILYPTLQQTILKEPLLAVSFADLYNSKPLFIRLPEIDLDRIVRFIVVNDDEDIKQLLEEEHAKKFNVEDNTIPLWRIIVGIKKTSSVVKEGVSNNWNLLISIFWHHSIGDGRSALVFYSSFHESLLEILSKNNDSLKDSSNILTSKITLPQQSTIPEPLEQCINLKCSLSFLIKEAFKGFVIPKFLKGKLLKGCWLGDVPTFSLSKNTTRVLLYSITAEELNSLIKQSRQHKTTITSLFNIAVLFSSYHHLIHASNQDNSLSNSAKELAPFDTVKLNTCINLRPYSTPELPWTQAGVYVSESILTYKYPKPNNTTTDNDKNNYPELDFWKMSREFKGQLNEDIPNAIEHLGMTNLLPKDRKGFENLLKKDMNGEFMGRKFSFMVSNIGKFSKISSSNFEGNNNSSNEWKIDDLIFSQSAVTFSSAIIINVISYEYNLTFTITYQTGAVNHEKVVRFGEGIVKCLKFVAQNENVTLQDLV
jgi:hypothetical protein